MLKLIEANTFPHYNWLGVFALLDRKRFLKNLLILRDNK